MNTPEATALNLIEVERLAAFVKTEAPFADSEWAEYGPRLLTTIAERDERVRELEAQAQKWFQECLRLEGAALKSTAVSGDDRDELVNIIAERTSDGRANAGIVADVILAAGFRRSQESSQTHPTVGQETTRCTEVLRASAATLSASLTEPTQESSQTNIAVSPDASPRPTMDGTLSSASPAEPVKIAGREELAKWFCSRRWNHTCQIAPSEADYNKADALLASGIITGRKFSRSKIRAIVRRKVTSAEEADDITDTLLYPTADIWEE